MQWHTTSARSDNMLCEMINKLKNNNIIKFKKKTMDYL